MIHDYATNGDDSAGDRKELGIAPEEFDKQFLAASKPKPRMS